MDYLQEKIQGLVKRVIDNEGFEFVDAIFTGPKSSKTIRVFIDREGGVSIGDCVYISRKFSDLLDSEGEQSEMGQYRIEVSSPGIDHPLREGQDFRRNVGREVGIHFISEGIQNYVEGTILCTDSDSVYLQTKGKEMCVDFSSIQQAKIQVKWK